MSPSRSRFLAFALPLAVLVAQGMLPAAAHARPKTDVVLLKNGDRITCEIKEMDRGILEASTDGMGTVNVEWDDVDSLSSTYRYRVEDRAGRKYFGGIVKQRGGPVQVGDTTGTVEIAAMDVVEMASVARSFRRQLDGSVSLGYSFTKANSLGQLTLDASFRHETKYHLITLKVSSLTTTQEDEEAQTRDKLDASHRRLFSGRFFTHVEASFERNDELGLDLRSALDVGPGMNIIRSDHNHLVAIAGASANRELSEEDTNNLEALLALGYQSYQFDFPKIDITCEFAVYPSLTTSGRVRSELEIDARREIVSDFFLEVSFYDSYDSKPSDGGDAKNDFGTVTGIGWSF